MWHLSRTIPIITSLFLKKFQGKAAVTFFQVISMNFFKNKYLGRFKKNELTIAQTKIKYKVADFSVLARIEK